MKKPIKPTKPSETGKIKFQFGFKENEPFLDGLERNLKTLKRKHKKQVEDNKEVVDIKFLLSNTKAYNNRGTFYVELEDEEGKNRLEEYEIAMKQYEEELAAFKKFELEQLEKKHKSLFEELGL